MVITAGTFISKVVLDIARIPYPFAVYFVVHMFC